MYNVDYKGQHLQGVFTIVKFYYHFSAITKAECVEVIHEE